MVSLEPEAFPSLHPEEAEEQWGQPDSRKRRKTSRCP